MKYIPVLSQRKKLFKIALILADGNVKSFADTIGVSRQMVSQVINEKDSSLRILNEIDGFINLHINKLKGFI